MPPRPSVAAPNQDEALLLLQKPGIHVDVVYGILAGTPIVAKRGRGYRAPRQNAMIAVFNVASFRPLNNYQTDIQELAEFVKGLPRREGFDELLLPGERGNRGRVASQDRDCSLWTEPTLLPEHGRGPNLPFQLRG